MLLLLMVQRILNLKTIKKYPILIWAEIIDNRLYMGFYGKEEAPEVKWHHNITNIVKAPKYYKNNPYLKPGEEKNYHSRNRWGGNC